MRRRRIAASAAVAGAVALAAALGATFHLLPDRGVVVSSTTEAQRTASAAAGDTAPDAGNAAPSRQDTVFRRHFQAGVSFLQRGHYRQAADVFGLARRIAPGVPEVHVNLGYAYLGLEEPELAVPAFRHAIDLRPAQANAYFGLAEALKALGDDAGALGAARTYVHLTPEDDPFRRQALAAIWELQEALKVGSSMILDDPGSEPAEPEKPEDAPK